MRSNRSSRSGTEWSASNERKTADSPTEAGFGDRSLLAEGISAVVVTGLWVGLLLAAAAPVVTVAVVAAATVLVLAVRKRGSLEVPTVCVPRTDVCLDPATT